MHDVAIIGAGVVGAAIAAKLSKYKLSIVVLDKENDASIGTTKANSGIIHAGYDAQEGSLMAKLNVKSNPLFDSLCESLSVPFRRVGSLVVAFDDDQMAHIINLYKRGVSNGVQDMRVLNKAELLEMEPNINPRAMGALHAKTAGIIDPMLLAISLLENSVANGAEVIFNFEVESIDRTDMGWLINSNARTVNAKTVVNAAGVYADRIHSMVSTTDFSITPVRGQYYLLDKCDFGAVSSVVFPCPTKAGKGILITPTVHGNILVGPTAEAISDKEDVSTDDEALRRVKEGLKLLIPELNTRNNIRSFSGLRARADKGDFIIKEVKDAPGFINVAGIMSPGLSAAPAIGEYVATILKNMGMDFVSKAASDPIVNRRLLHEMPEKEQDELIMRNPLYGRVICRCENITEGDIIDSIRRVPGASTIDGVKRRCRAGMGRCQGGFCTPKVQQILARELKMPLEDIVLEKNGSYILTEKTK